MPSECSRSQPARRAATGSSVCSARIRSGLIAQRTGSSCTRDVRGPPGGAQRRRGLAPAEDDELHVGPRRARARRSADGRRSRFRPRHRGRGTGRSGPHGASDPDVTLVRSVPAPETVPAIAVVVVCHNSADALRDTLPALAAQLGYGRRGRRRGQRLERRRRRARARRSCRARPSSTRPGTSASPRAATSAPARRTRRSILLLNPDAVPQPGFLEALRGAAADAPGVGGLAGARHDGRRPRS